jgi:hypothetical protein
LIISTSGELPILSLFSTDSPSLSSSVAILSNVAYLFESFGTKLIITIIAVITSKNDPRKRIDFLI